MECTKVRIKLGDMVGLLCFAMLESVKYRQSYPVGFE